MKVCASCKQSKAKIDFGSSKGNKDGLHSYCAACRKIKRKKYDTGPAGKNKSLMRNYGITLDAFNVLLDSQGGHCALCERTELLGLDHCHATLKVRGILCRKCNLALGHFDDSIPKMVAAITYLGK